LPERQISFSVSDISLRFEGSLKNIVELLENWPYLAAAFSAATIFYLVTIFAVSQLTPDKKAALSLWLEGS
jgi:hypothetical protein